MFFLKQWRSIERCTLFESDLFRAHFRKIVILSNFQVVDLIQIEKKMMELTTQEGQGVNQFLNQIKLKKPKF